MDEETKAERRHGGRSHNSKRERIHSTATGASGRAGGGSGGGIRSFSASGSRMYPRGGTHTDINDHSDDDGGASPVFFKPRFENGQLTLVPTLEPGFAVPGLTESKREHSRRLRPASASASGAREHSRAAPHRLRPTSARGSKLQSSSSMHARLLEATLLSSSSGGRIADAARRKSRKQSSGSNGGGSRPLSASLPLAGHGSPTESSSNKQHRHRSNGSSKKSSKKGKRKKDGKAGRSRSRGRSAQNRKTAEENKPHPAHAQTTSAKQEKWASPTQRGSSFPTAKLWVRHDDDFIFSQPHVAILCDTASGCRAFDSTLRALRGRDFGGQQDSSVFTIEFRPPVHFRANDSAGLGPQHSTAAAAALSVRPLSPGRATRHGQHGTFNGGASSNSTAGEGTTVLELTRAALAAVVGDSPIFSAVLLRHATSEIASAFAKMDSRLKEEFFKYIVAKLRCDTKGSRVFWSAQAQRLLTNTAGGDAESAAASKLASLFKGWKTRRDLFDDVYPLLADLADPDGTLANRLATLDPPR